MSARTWAEQIVPAPPVQKTTLPSVPQLLKSALFSLTIAQLSSGNTDCGLALPSHTKKAVAPDVAQVLMSLLGTHHGNLVDVCFFWGNLIVLKTDSLAWDAYFEGMKPRCPRGSVNPTREPIHSTLLDHSEPRLLTIRGRLSSQLCTIRGSLHRLAFNGSCNSCQALPGSFDCT